MSFASVLVAVTPLLAPAAPVEAPRPEPRERIGTVLGQPIYRDQIRDEFPVSSELHRLVHPAIQQYLDQHGEQVKPTDAELAFASAYFRRHDPEMWEKQDAERKAEIATLESTLVRANISAAERRQHERQLTALREHDPARFFAQFIVGGRKLNRHLYKAFGGGRIVWQQGGVEAFDAHRRWLEALERRGDFSFDDPALRAEFYAYWTNEEQHRTWLSTPEKSPDAFQEFLSPPWLPGGTAEQNEPEE